MAREIEREVSLELIDRTVIAAVARLREILERLVRSFDVRHMVLVVMQLEQLTRVGGLESAVRIRPAGQRVRHRCVLLECAARVAREPMQRAYHGAGLRGHAPRPKLCTMGARVRLTEALEPGSVTMFDSMHVKRGSRARKILWIAAGLVLLAGLPALWKWTPLSDWASIENGAALFSSFRSSNFVALWVVVFYVIGALLFLPINLFIFLTALFFDNLGAYGFVALGVGVNSATGYVLGRLGSSFVIRRIDSERLELLSKKLAGSDFVDLFLFRLIPVTPFSTINVLCGLVEVPVTRFFGATFTSIAPGATLIIMFESALMAFGRNMNWQTGLLLTAALAALVGAAFALKRWVSARRARR